ncbi:hypothetical protein NRB16_10190 [Pseudomonas sp. LJDD11]|uniref:hypothetical protein n=1 Tax=Pseudomonas sp. LJDD11 TaxID=2931984 RepID=UPI00211C13A4|nr:hypothetical protein [Pseudomonas sp. LJDD11]MCQ9423893.1 hypothetical protein [Pseudomonas sp. LJDD11]
MTDLTSKRDKHAVTDRTHDQVMAELLRADPVYARALFGEVLRGGDSEELAILVRQIQLSDIRVGL